MSCAVSWPGRSQVRTGVRRGSAAVHCRSALGVSRERGSPLRVLVDRESVGVEKVGPAKVPEIFAPADLFRLGVWGSNTHGLPKKSRRLVIRCGASSVSAELLLNACFQRIFLSISHVSGDAGLGDGRDRARRWKAKRRWDSGERNCAWPAVTHSSDHRDVLQAIIPPHFGPPQSRTRE